MTTIRNTMIAELLRKDSSTTRGELDALDDVSLQRRFNLALALGGMRLDAADSPLGKQHAAPRNDAEEAEAARQRGIDNLNAWRKGGAPSPMVTAAEKARAGEAQGNEFEAHGPGAQAKLLKQMKSETILNNAMSKAEEAYRRSVERLNASRSAGASASASQPKAPLTKDSAASEGGDDHQKEANAYRRSVERLSSSRRDSSPSAETINTNSTARWV